MPANRSALRAQFRAARKSLSSHSRADFERTICDHLWSFAPVANATTVAIYLATDGEPDLDDWVQAAWRSGKSLALPSIETPLEAEASLQTKIVAGKASGPTASMQFRAYTATTELTPNRFGIMQPPADALAVSQLDCVLMPLVAYDTHGARLGMGGGYYDRYFYDIRDPADPHKQTPILVGVAFSCQKSASALPKEDWDVPMDAIVTPLGIEAFRGIHGRS